jgi:predicted RNA polymerase sigma factor
MATEDPLELLLLCSHPTLPPSSQVALALRAVGGLTTAEIARLLLVPEPAVARRIGEAERRLAGVRCGPRIPAVLDVLHRIFDEGDQGGARPELAAEAIRLTRRLRALLPADGEVAGLLALMLLVEARRPAATAPDGGLVPPAEQDRTAWDAAAIAEGTGILRAALATAPVGPYQLRAAIAAVHDAAARAEDTDWPQILALHNHLQALSPGPLVTLGRIEAVAEVHGPRAALAQLTAAAVDPALAEHAQLPAVRAHLLEAVGDLDAAAVEFRAAARRALSARGRRYLERRAARLAR